MSRSRFLKLRSGGVSLLWLTALGTFAASARGQVAGLSARQLFYQKPTPVASTNTGSTAKGSSKGGTQVAVAKKSAEKRHKGGKTPAESLVVDVTAATTRAEDVGAASSVATLATDGQQPLAIRYSILKLDPDPANDRTNPGVEVPVSAVFHSGDRIRLQVQTNQDGYLYVVNRGPSGVWKPLLPSRNAPNNFIRGRSQPVAPVTARFDEQAGEESLFLVFSRQRRDDLDELVEGLRGRAGPPAGARAAPSAAPARQLDDKAVSQLRQVYSRDLIVESVQDAAPPVSGNQDPGATVPDRETATFAASTSTNPNDPLIVDIKLVHK